MNLLYNYEAKRIQDWATEIDQTSQEKLRQPLLRRDKDVRRLFVNFDDALVRLLREVHYLLTLLQVKQDKIPQQAQLVRTA